jgi:serine phosphatase RsbU (regulator of sigma subunit)
VLFTDGVTEAENAEERELGLESVCEMLNGQKGDAQEILDTIDDHVRAHMGELAAGDDVTMLALTRLG